MKRLHGLEKYDNSLKKRSKKEKRMLVSFSFFSRFRSFLMKFFLGWIPYVFAPLFFGVRVKNKHQFYIARKKRDGKGRQGIFTISNHCFYLDPGLIHFGIFPHFAFYGIDEKTMSMPSFGWFLKSYGGFALPKKQPMLIGRTVADLIQRKKIVHFFPEGNLLDYNQTISSFQQGVFYFALMNQAPILPIAIVLKKRKIFSRLTKPFPRVIISFGEPVYSDDYLKKGLSRLEILEAMGKDLEKAVQKLIDDEGGDKSLFDGKIHHRI